MFNKERFHNQLALNLGYQLIVNDKHIKINMDDKQYPDDVMVSISIDGFSQPICYNASKGIDRKDIDCLDEKGCEGIMIIANAVHQAYLEANKKLYYFNE